MKKRMVAIVLVLLLVSSVALAETVKLQINSTQKLSKQFDAFRAYLSQLPAEDRAAWDAELADMVEENRSSLQLGLLGDYQRPGVVTSFDESEKMVWIPKTGSKYHRTSTCSNMKNPQQVTLSNAISRGYDLCGRCKP